MSDQRASVFPTHGNRDEIQGRRELEIHVKALLQRRKLAHQRVVLGANNKIDVHRAVTPPFQYSRGPSDQEDACRGVSGAGKGIHDDLDACAIDYRTHAIARSKLTSRRTIAL